MQIQWHTILPRSRASRELQLERDVGGKINLFHNLLLPSQLQSITANWSVRLFVTETFETLSSYAPTET